MNDLLEKLARAREVSWQHHGKRLEVFLPGMFVAYGERGRYPAVSITGRDCGQGCKHCGGTLLDTMHQAKGAEALLEKGLALWEAGNLGILLSGGNTKGGRLPWEEALPAIRELSQRTGLIITAHVGRIDPDTARRLKDAGVRQALLDVVGDPKTAREILNLPDGLAAQEESLAACQAAGLELVPHVIVGLHGGAIRGERAAVMRVAGFNPRTLVFVVFMPLKGTELAKAVPSTPEEVAELLAWAREVLPQARHHLGCARPRGDWRRRMDRLAVLAGVNALALPSDAALDTAKELGLEVGRFATCCSVAA